MKNLSTFFSRRGFIAISLASTLLMLAGCSSDRMTASKPLRVLFIGNSYIYYNMLPEMLQQMAIAGKQRPLEYRMIAPGGCSLEQHWKTGVAPKAIAEGGWDYVVLQEQSLLPISNSAGMFKHARLLDQEVRKVGGKTVFYVTWARKGMPAQQQPLTAAYSSIARELGALCSPVGPARAAVSAQQPTLELYQPDGSHPSAAGTYLAACVFYDVLYGKSPIGLPGTVAGKGDDGKLQTLVQLTPEVTDLLQNTAVQTVKEWNGGKTPPGP